MANKLTRLWKRVRGENVPTYVKNPYNTKKEQPKKETPVAMNNTTTTETIYKPGDIFTLPLVHKIFLKDTQYAYFREGWELRQIRAYDRFVHYPTPWAGKTPAITPKKNLKINEQLALEDKL